MATKPKKPLVIALYRVSTEEQSADDRAGLDRQKEVVGRVVSYNNLEVVRTITLIDVSGANVLHNREYMQMLAEVESGEVDGVVVSDVDRLVRAKSMITAATVTEAFQTGLAKIYTGGMTYDMATDDGAFIAAICTLMGGNELRTIHRRMYGAKEEIRKRGGFPSSKITLPRGVEYTRKIVKGVDVGHWHYNDKEVAAVQEAFRIIDEEGITNISEVARLVGIQNRTLHNLLRNPIYTGWRVYDKKRGKEIYYKPDGKQADRKKVTRDKPIRVKVIDQPAVSQERFDRVQKKLNDTGTKWRRQRLATEINLGTGIAVCGHCGRRLYPSSGKRQDGKDRVGYYYCSANDYLNRRKGTSCPQPNIPKPILDETLIKFAGEHLASVEVIEALAKKLHAPVEESTRPALEKKLADIENRKKRILNLYEAEAIELAEYKSRKAELENEAGTIRRLIQSEIERNRIREQADDSIQLLVTACVGIARLADKAELREALRGLFAKVVFQGETIVGCELLIPGMRPACSTEIGIHSDRGSSRRPT